MTHYYAMTKMAISAEDRILLKAMRIEKGYVVRQLLKEFPFKPWSLTSLPRLLTRLMQLVQFAEKKAVADQIQRAQSKTALLLQISF